MSENPLSGPVANASPPQPLVSGSLLFFVSVAGLFLELLLIRWIATEMRLFTYLQNAVLVVCFLGLGMGCWSCRQPFALRDILLPLALLIFIMAVIVIWMDMGKYSKLLEVFYFSWYSERSWDELLGPSPLRCLALMALETVLAFLILMIVWDMFVPVGRLLGRLLNDHPNTIQAYSINIAGSLIGIWLFVLLSVLYLRPVMWVVVAAGLLIVIGRRTGGVRQPDFLLLAAIVGLGWLASWQPGAIEVFWSPYQKLALELPDENSRFARIGKYIVRVNTGAYQGMLDLSPETVREHPDIYPKELAGLSQYDIPLLLHPKPHKVLIVGAGSGNDVAGARRHDGVGQITAVDIDPGIILLGKRYHPEQPYADESMVHVVNDDARSYFATCTERFDVIIFGLLDAPLQAGAANVHLDNYVYTRESLRRARELLADNGVLVLTFERIMSFLPERMLETCREVFRHDPVNFYIPTTTYGWGGVMFVIAEDQDKVKAQIAANPRLAAQVARWQADYSIPQTGEVGVISDDWPYLYLQKPGIPILYILFAGLMVLLFFRGLRRLKTPGLLRSQAPSRWHFFFLGAAFMLLETQNISKAAVVLGNTWWVNAVIISGILALILLANLIAARFPGLPLGPVYALLVGSCLALYFVDLSRFAFLPYAGKVVVVGLLTSWPMLFSGIVFIRSFAAVPAKDEALGANLFGALVGGLLQAVTFLTGIKALLVIVAAFYLVAFVTRPRIAGTKAAPTLEPAHAV
jgi:spermidine synthase